MTQLGFSRLLVSSRSSQQHGRVWNLLGMLLCSHRWFLTRQDRHSLAPGEPWVVEEGVLRVAG